MKSTDKIYNNNSIRDMLRKMPQSMKKYKPHRNEYIRNCINVFLFEKNKINLTYAESLRNYNFNLTLFYINQ